MPPGTAGCATTTNPEQSPVAAGSYTMSLSLEGKLPEDTVLELADESGGDYTGGLRITEMTKADKRRR